MSELLIKNSWVKPKYKYFDVNAVSKKPKRKLYVGMELEVNVGGFKERCFALSHPNTVVPWLYAKEDDSLVEDWGFEFVTHPATYEWIIAHRYEILQCIDVLKECGAWTDIDCGFHVHLSRSSFTRKHLIQFQKFIYNFQNFTRKIARRPKYVLDDWAALDESPEKIIHKSKLKVSKGNYKEKNVAVNTCHKNSIEVRIFRSFLNHQKIFQNLEYCVAVFDYTKTAKRLSLYGFWSWVKNHRKKYPHLYEFMHPQFEKHPTY